MLGLLHAVLSTDDTSVDDAHGCGGPGLVLSLLNKATNGTGEITVPLSSSPTDGLTLRTLTVKGLDTLQAADLLDPVGGAHLESFLVFDRLNVTVGGVQDGYSFNVTLDLRGDVTLGATLELLVSAAAVSALHVDQVARPGCLAGTVEGANVTAFALEADASFCGCATANDDLRVPRCPLLAEIVCKAITTGELVRSADDDAGDDSSRFIHGFLPILLPGVGGGRGNATCPSQAEIANEPTNDDGGGDTYVDFTAPGTPFAALQSAVLGTLDPVVIGQAVACAAFASSGGGGGGGESSSVPFGTFAVPGELARVSPLKLGPYGLELSLSDLEINGIGSLDVLSLLVPTAPHALKSRLGLAGPLKLSLSATVAASAAPNVVGGRLALNATLRLFDLSTAADPVLFDLARLGKLTLGQLQDPKYGTACLLTAFDALTLTELGLHLGSYHGDGSSSGHVPGLVVSFRPTGKYSSKGEGTQTWGPLDVAPLLNGLLNGSSPHSAALVNRLLIGPALAAANASCQLAGGGSDGRNSSRHGGDDDDDALEAIQDDAVDLDAALWQLRSAALALALFVALLCISFGLRLTRCGASGRRKKKGDFDDYAAVSLAPPVGVSNGRHHSEGGESGKTFHVNAFNPIITTTTAIDDAVGNGNGSTSNSPMTPQHVLGGGLPQNDSVNSDLSNGGGEDPFRGGASVSFSSQDSHPYAAAAARPVFASFASSESGGGGSLVPHERRGGHGHDFGHNFGHEVDRGEGGDDLDWRCISSNPRVWGTSLKRAVAAHARRHNAMLRHRLARGFSGGGGGGDSDSGGDSAAAWRTNAGEFYRNGATTHEPPAPDDVDVLCLSPRVSPTVLVAFPAFVLVVILLFIMSNTADSSVDVMMHLEIGDIQLDTPSFFTFTLQVSER